MVEDAPDIALRLSADHLHGFAMAVYSGGRAECRIRRTAVPMVYVDFLSMYPTVNALMELWGVLSAERIETTDATEEVRRTLDGVTADRCFESEFWRQLPVLVQIEPNGDVLLVRAKYGELAWQIGFNVLEEAEPLWYTLADCVASTLLAGMPPKMLRALRLVPSGERQPGMKAVALRNAVAVDPAVEDFFRAVIQQRKPR